MKFDNLEIGFLMGNGRYTFGSVLRSIQFNGQYPYIILPYIDDNVTFISYKCIPRSNPVNYSSFLGGVLDNFTLAHFSNTNIVGLNYAYLRINGTEISRSIAYRFNQETNFICQNDGRGLGNLGSNIVVNGVYQSAGGLEIARITNCDIMEIIINDNYGNDFKLIPAIDEFTGDCGLFDTYTQLFYTNSNFNGGKFELEI